MIKGLYPEYMKNSCKIRKRANLVKTRQWRPDWPLQGETQMTNKYMKRCPISLVIREIQIKPQ